MLRSLIVFRMRLIYLSWLLMLDTYISKWIDLIHCMLLAIMNTLYCKDLHWNKYCFSKRPMLIIIECFDIIFPLPLKNMKHDFIPKSKQLKITCYQLRFETKVRIYYLLWINFHWFLCIKNVLIYNEERILFKYNVCVSLSQISYLFYVSSANFVS